MSGSVNPNNIPPPQLPQSSGSGNSPEPTTIVNDMIELWILSQGDLGNDLGNQNVISGQVLAQCIADLVNRLKGEAPAAGTPDAQLYQWLTTPFTTSAGTTTTLGALANAIMNAQSQGTVDTTDINTLIASLTQPISGQETPAQFFWSSITGTSNTWFQEINQSGGNYYSWPLDAAQTAIFQNYLSNDLSMMQAAINTLENLPSPPNPSDQIAALQQYSSALMQIYNEFNNQLPGNPFTQTLDKLLNSLYPVGGTSGVSALALLENFANPSYSPTKTDVYNLIAILQPQGSSGFAQVLSDFIQSITGGNNDNIYNNGPFPSNS